ncbi:MAG: tetratricopeptide repeat protein [bacterium]
MNLSKQSLRTAALLLAALLLAPFLATAQPALPLSLAEVRQARDLRDAREGGDQAALVGSAEKYLKKFPAGRYRDEALLALGEAHRSLDRPEKALEAYERLIAEFPDSAFREQALVESLPLLQRTGAAGRAAARLALLRENFPRSLVLGKALLWKARLHFEKREFKEAAALLDTGTARVGLSAAESAEWLRLSGWSLLETGRHADAWPVFAEYLEREDAIGRKATVLMRLARRSRKLGAVKRALGYYILLIDRFPHPGSIREALYRRAELYVLIARGRKDGVLGAETLARAVGFYDAILQEGAGEFFAPALRGRAQLLAQAGRTADALADHERLAALGPQYRLDPALVEARAGLLSEGGRSGEAVALLEGVLASRDLPRPARSVLAVTLAALQYERGECAAVLRALHPLPVFRDRNRRKRAFFLRGFCHLRERNWEKASFDLEGLLTDPDYEGRVWEALVEAYERSGQWARLVRAGEMLLASERVGPRETLLISMASGYQKLGEPERMLSVLDKLAEVNPAAMDNPEIGFQRGLAEEALGRPEPAARHFLAVVRAPESAGAKTIAALEHLQALLIDIGEYAQLTKVNAAAEPRMAAEGRSTEWARWQAHAYVAWARSEAKKENPVAASQKFAAAERAFEVGLGGAAEASEQRSLIAAEFSAMYLAWADSTAGAQPAELARRYHRALELMPPEAWRRRFAISQRLDELYRAEGNYAGRAKLFEVLLPAVPEGQTRAGLRRHLARIFLQWGKQESGEQKYKAANALFSKGQALLLPGEMQLRYEFVAGLGEVHLARGDYSQLTIDYERILPELKDPQLTAEVERFLGQVYLAWARRAEKKNNSKSVTIRAYRVLKYLPKSDWRSRLAATTMLAAVLDEQDKPALPATLFADLIPTLPEGRLRQKYSLLLSARYLEKLNRRALGWKWLTRADTGNNDAYSLEAGYRMADLELKANRLTAGSARLEKLVARGLKKSKWRVPIHYRLAVVYHEREAIRKALRHYRVVAGVKSRELKKLYPRSIDQARRQVKAIGEYLRLRGGEGGRGIAVPKIKP